MQANKMEARAKISSMYGKDVLLGVNKRNELWVDYKQKGEMDTPTRNAFVMSKHQARAMAKWILRNVEE